MQLAQPLTIVLAILLALAVVVLVAGYRSRGLPALVDAILDDPEAASVTAPDTAWDDHVDSALAVVDAGRAYTVQCQRCPQVLTGTRRAVLAHLKDVLGRETAEQAATLRTLDQELTS